MVFGRLYFLIDSIAPNSFHGIDSADLNSVGLKAGYENQFNLLYYSYTTLSTLGVGDITPLNQLAKSLTIIECVFGQLFVATAIAKLVSVWKPASDKSNANKTQ